MSLPWPSQKQGRREKGTATEHDLRPPAAWDLLELRTSCQWMVSASDHPAWDGSEWAAEGGGDEAFTGSPHQAMGPGRGPGSCGGGVRGGPPPGPPPRLLAPAVVLALVAAVFGAVPARATDLICFDRPITIQGTDRGEVLTGTPGPDVI